MAHPQQVGDRGVAAGGTRRQQAGEAPGDDVGAPACRRVREHAPRHDGGREPGTREDAAPEPVETLGLEHGAAGEQHPGHHVVTRGREAGPAPEQPDEQLGGAVVVAAQQLVGGGRAVATGERRLRRDRAGGQRGARPGEGVEVGDAAARRRRGKEPPADHEPVGRRAQGAVAEPHPGAHRQQVDGRAVVGQHQPARGAGGAARDDGHHPVAAAGGVGEVGGEPAARDDERVDGRTVEHLGEQAGRRDRDPRHGRLLARHAGDARCTATVHPMGKVANRGPGDLQKVPTGVDAGVPLTRVLATPSLAGARVLAGAAGLHRPVTRVNVMEVPDVQAWVRPGELLLTTGYSVRESPDQLVEVVEALAERQVAALAVKLGRYLDALPDAALAAAERLGLPVVGVEPHVSFDDVLTEVMTEVLSEQVTRRTGGAARTEHVHRVLVDVVLSGGGLEAVADALAHQLDVAVVVTTPDGRVVAQAGDEAGLEAVRTGPWADRTGRLRTEDASFALGLHGSHAVAEIGARGLDHGRLAVFATDRELDDDDLVAVQRSATVCALVVTRDLAVAAVEDRYRADHLRDLLVGRQADDPDVVAHARGFGWDLDRDLLVLVLEPDPDDDAAQAAGRSRRPVVERQAAALGGALRQRDAGAAVAALRTETVAVVGAPSGSTDLRRWVRDVVGEVRGEGGGGRRPFGVGVSRVCAGVGGLAAAYEQARTAVRVGRQVHGAGACTHFDDLGVYRLLSLVPDDAELVAFASETLGELAGDGEQAADLRRTLEVLLETNVNVAETSRRLHFHYNTLRYRIGKLERVVGPFTTEPTLRLDLALALKVVAMRGLRPGLRRIAP